MDTKNGELALRDVILIVIAIWCFISLIPIGIGALSGLDIGQRGQIGDMFGFSNSFFSSMAFALVVYTVYLQRKDLDLTREELRLTRDELKRSAEAQEESQEALNKQAASLEVSTRMTAINHLLTQHVRELEALIIERNSAESRGLKALRDKKQEELDRHIDERKKLINELYEIKDRYDNLWSTSSQKQE